MAQNHMVVHSGCTALERRFFLCQRKPCIKMSVSVQETFLRLSVGKENDHCLADTSKHGTL